MKNVVFNSVKDEETLYTTASRIAENMIDSSKILDFDKKLFNTNGI